MRLATHDAGAPQSSQRIEAGSEHGFGVRGRDAYRSYAESEVGCEQPKCKGMDAGR